jgi:hypothetical protein
VQIDYCDWLEIERSLNLHAREISTIDLTRYAAAIGLTEEPLAFQSRIRAHHKSSLKDA